MRDNNCFCISISSRIFFSFTLYQHSWLCFFAPPLTETRPKSAPTAALVPVTWTAQTPPVACVMLCPNNSLVMTLLGFLVTLPTGCERSERRLSYAHSVRNKDQKRDLECGRSDVGLEAAGCWRLSATFAASLKCQCVLSLISNSHMAFLCIIPQHGQTFPGYD